jgi:hypothetical protein
VELVALLPLLLAIALVVFCGLAAGRARELAGHGAQAGAVALLQDRDPAEAAREALPGHTRRESHIEVRGTRVVVTVRPRLPVPALARRLASTQTADAGPGSQS